MNAPDPALLRQLARLYGVQTRYAGMGGQRVEANPDSVLAVLKALGAKTDNLAASLGQRRRELWHWRLEPVLVAWDGELARIPLRLPNAEATGSFSLRLGLEDGSSRSAEGDLAATPALTSHDLGGERHLKLGLPGFSGLPLGYHHLTLEAAGRSLEALVIAAPRRTYAAPDRRTWGPFLPLYALHSRRSWGVGDLTDLDGLVDWAASRGAGFVGTLPLLASFLDEPFEPSPYAPVSRLFWNELFIDPARPITPSQSPNADRSADMPAEATALNDEELVPYRKAMALKRRVLEAQLASLSGDERDAMQRYVDEHPRLRDYARFRTAGETYGPNWREWPGPARYGDLDNAELPEDAEAYHAYAQWRIETQMQETARRSREQDVALYVDLPVGVHADGYDAWRYQDLFVDGMSVGAPPDVVTTSGQDWGFQPLAPEALRRSGYAYFIDYLRHHFETAGILRVDHAMGLHRLYWVPRGDGARNGVYVSYPAEEQYAVLCLESQRHEASVVFENLGIVTPAMDRAFEEHGVARMYVLSIELRDRDDPPFRPVPENVVASIGTHDLPPFAAWWRSSDIEERIALGVLHEERAAGEGRERWLQNEALARYLRAEGLLAADDESLEGVLRACLALLARSDAKRLLVSLEDLWLEDRPQNVPGTMADKYPSWRRRARYSLEEIIERPELTAALDAIWQHRGRP